MKKAPGAGSDLIFRGKTENFNESEFYCKCGCGAYNVKQSLVERLQYARKIAGVPFVINSGTRCIAHNAAVGGKPGSHHLEGLAVDICADPEVLIKYIGSQSRNTIYRHVYLTQPEIFGLLLPALLEARFKRIGVYFDAKFIHVDVKNWFNDQPVKIWGGK